MVMMLLGMRIAIDLDGVLANSMASWLRIWNERHSPRLRYEDIDEWDFWRKIGIDERRFSEIFNEAWEGWASIPPMEDDLPSKLRSMRMLGKVDVVTGRPRSNTPYIKSWLRMHSIPYDDLKVGVSSKARFPHIVFVDDSPANAREIALTGRLVLLRDQPWNRDVRETRLIRRVTDLGEAIEVIESLLDGGE